MTGPTTPDHRYNDPTPLARAAGAFPRLDFVVYHGYWPNVQQILGVAFRHPNVHIVPDMYLFLPGSRAFIDAANGFLVDQSMFGSSYPFRPIRQSIDDALSLGLRDSVAERFLFRNAERLLGLNPRGKLR